MGAKFKLVIYLYCCFQTDAIDNGSERSIRPKTQAIEPLGREQLLRGTWKTISDSVIDITSI